jgi:hypothetical protein
MSWDESIIDRINGVNSWGVNGVDFDKLTIDGKIFYHMTHSIRFFKSKNYELMFLNFNKEMAYREKNIKDKYCE